MNRPPEYDETIARPPVPTDPTLTFTGSAKTTVGEVPQVEGYEIKRELGRGGMGVVYLARQTKLNRDVALKMVIAGGQASDNDRVRFLAEAEIAAGLQHPGIVQVHEFGTYQGLPYFALEYCPRGSLADQLDGTPLPPQDAAELLVKLASAMEVAHGKGVVHRDLKPANVLIGTDGGPKITDFGLARRGGTSSGMTVAGAVMGTPSYMSPEQAEGNQDLIGPTTDVYALGAILYECLTGRPPFRAATAVDTIMQVVRDEPVPPSQLAAKLPRDLETICLKCLQKSPAKRYATAGGLADDLRCFLESRPIAARPVSRLERAWKAAKRHPTVSVSALAGLAGLIVVTAVVVVKNGQLHKERDAARDAERAAEVARRRAEAEHLKNQHLVDLAIEQQERLVSRLASVEWTGNPAMVAERHRVLTDVADFYQKLLRDEGDDPAVLNKNVEANTRLSMLYLHRNEYARSAEFNDKARQTLNRMANDPNVGAADVKANLARTEQMAGHLDLLQSKLPQGVGRYVRSVELAEEAVKLKPDNEELRTLLAECYTSVSLSMSADPVKSAEYADKVVKIGEELTRGPKPSYNARLILAAGLVQRGAVTLNQGKVKEGGDLLNRATPILDSLSREDPPTVQSREGYERTAANHSVSMGVVLSRTDRTSAGQEAASRHFIDGINRFDRAIITHPKSIPYRMAKMNALLQFAGTLQVMGKEESAIAKMADADALARTIVADNPQWTFLNDNLAFCRSLLLVHRVREGKMESFADRMLELHELKPRSGAPYGLVRYNMACAYAQAALRGTADSKERHAVEAVKLLNDLLDNSPYFTVAPQRVTDLMGDKDLDPLRERADFKAFLGRLPKPK